MAAISGVAHFSIPVSDIAKSTQFYTEVVGFGHLSTVSSGHRPYLMRPELASSW
jgi:predicted enzyme related to lactoylglutathione lyase